MKRKLIRVKGKWIRETEKPQKVKEVEKNEKIKSFERKKDKKYKS